MTLCTTLCCTCTCVVLPCTTLVLYCSVLYCSGAVLLCAVLLWCCSTLWWCCGACPAPLMCVIHHCCGSHGLSSSCTHLSNRCGEVQGQGCQVSFLGLPGRAGWQAATPSCTQGIPHHMMNNEKYPHSVRPQHASRRSGRCHASECLV